MLLLMLLNSRIADGFLQLFLFTEMKFRVICQVVQGLYRHRLLLARLTAVQELVDFVNQLLVLGINHLITCYQTLVKFSSHLRSPPTLYCFYYTSLFLNFIIISFVRLSLDGSTGISSRSNHSARASSSLSRVISSAPSKSQ